MILPLMLIL